MVPNLLMCADLSV